MSTFLRRTALFAAVAAAVMVVPGAHAARPSLTAGTTSTSPWFCVTGCPLDVLVWGLGGSMSTPALRGAVAGNVGRFEKPMTSWIHSNSANTVTASGAINGLPVRVVSHADAGWGSGETGSGRASVVHGISGLDYRYTVFSADVYNRTPYPQDNPPVPPSVVVTSIIKSFPHCTRHGLTRDPVRDCLPGTQTRVSGIADLTNVTWTPGTVVTFTAPLTGLGRPIDSRSRPLANWTTLGNGHWTVRAALDPNGISSLWSTEWNVAGIGSGWQAGAAYTPNWRTTATTVAFHTGPYA